VIGVLAMNAAYVSTATAMAPALVLAFHILGRFGDDPKSVLLPFFFSSGPNPDTGKSNRRVTCNLSASNKFFNRACAFRQEVIEGAYR